MAPKDHECQGLGRCVRCAERIARQASVDRNRRWAETDFRALAKAMRAVLRADQRAQSLECPHEFEGKEDGEFCEPCLTLYGELAEAAADARDRVLAETEDLFA